MQSICMVSHWLCSVASSIKPSIAPLIQNDMMMASASFASGLSLFDMKLANSFPRASNPHTKWPLVAMKEHSVKMRCRTHASANDSVS